MVSIIVCLWILPAITVLISYVVYRWKKRRLFSFAAKVKGVKGGYPLLGMAPKFLFKNSSELFRLLDEVCSTPDTLIKAWFGPGMMLKVSDPEDLQLVLHSPNCLDKAYVYKFFKCGKGIFPSSVSVWKKNRKLLNSTFNAKILKSFFPIFNEKDLILVEQMSVHLNKGEFNIQKMIEKCTIDSICETTMGINLHFQSDSREGIKFLNGIRTLLNTVTARVFNIFHHPKIIFNLTRESKIQKQAIKDCMATIRKVIENKRAELEKNNSVSEQQDEDEAEYKKPQIYINQLFQLAKEKDFIDDNAISDHVFALIFGGYETSAFAISTTISLLAMHQDVQERVVQELREVFYSADEPVDYELISKLNYLEMVLKETMRLYPSAPYILRHTTGDVALKDPDLVIPPDVTVGIPIYNIHRDPKHWGPNANDFNPDNFLPDRVERRHPFAYIPFSAGPRGCLGIKYAMFAMKTMLAILLRKYKFSTRHSINTFGKKFEIMLRLEQEHLVSIEARNF